MPFPWALPVAEDAFGEAATVVIGGQRVDLLLPVRGTEQRSLVEPPSRAVLDPRVVREIRVGGLPDPIPWGWAQTIKGRGGQVGAVRASLLVTRTTGELRRAPEMEALAVHFPAWFSIVRGWLIAWTRSLPPVTGVVDRNACLLAMDGDRVTGVGASINVFHSEAARDASWKEVRSALQRASRGEQLPIEHELLQSSDAAIMQRDCRRAVIDAATAAEVSLSKAVSSVLLTRGTPRPFIDRAIKHANGLMGVLDLYRSLGGQSSRSKNQVQTSLAERRNDAAHGGHVPSDQEARLALQIARDLVIAASPLPSA
jgi:hypothetical protein